MTELEQLEDRVLLSSTTDPNGGNQAHEDRQPFLTTTWCIAMQGIYPSRDGGTPDGFTTGGTEPYLGEIVEFAFNFAPRGFLECNGQLLSIAQNTALFSLLGTTFGGNGTTNFALPDLRGRTPIGVGTGPGLSPIDLGEVSGSESEGLSVNQMPAHTHTVPGDVTGSTGGNQAVDNMMPTLGLNPIIDLNGEIAWVPYNFAPVGTAFANGQLLPLGDAYDFLFANIGTTYGGNGTTDFRLPDLRGRVALDDGSGGGLTSRALGSTTGTETVTLTTANLPAHSHTIPAGGSTGSTGSGQAFGNMQPSLTLNSQIAMQGVYPSRNLTLDASGLAAIDSDGQSLSQADADAALSGLVEAAISRWAAAGASAEAIAALHSATYQFGSLDTGILASVDGPHVVTIDLDAAGLAWYFDSTPEDDVEFGATDPQRGLLASTLGAQSGVDLLTVLMHEQGHMLGFGHTSTPGSLMSESFSAGSRRLPVDGALASVQTDVAPENLALQYDPFLGAIHTFAGGVGPNGFTTTSGQALPIAQNAALFSLLGTTYGGNGTTTFAVPNRQGRVALGIGQGPGLSSYTPGQIGGVETVTLSTSQLPSHTHTLPTAANPDVSVTKTDGVTTAVPGTSVTYTIVVSNSGSGAATATSFTDNFPSAITSATWTSTAAGGATGNTQNGTGNISQTLNLPVGASVTYVVTANISASVTGTLVNTATVSQVGDANAANDSATDTDTLTPQTNVGVTKSDGVTSVNAGGSTTYTIVVSNSGPSTAVATSLVDNLPAAITSATWTSVAAGGATGNTANSSGNIAETLTLPAGATVTYTVTANISAGASGSLVNTASVSQANDTNAGNNSATDTDSIVAQASEVSVTKTDGVTSVVSGGTTTYTIVVSNSGPNTATSTSFIDNFPAAITSATWTSVAAGGATGNSASGAGNISQTLNLPAGSSVTYTVTANVSPAATGSLVNTATVSNAIDVNPANNSATDTDSIIVVSAATVIIIDNASSSGYAETGSWKNKASSGTLGYLGNLRYANPNATVYSGTAYDNGVRIANPGDVEFATANVDTATFTFTGLQAGTYQVAVTYAQGANRATNASFTVSGTGVSDQVVAVNQKLVPSSFTAVSTPWKTLVPSFGSISVGGTITVTLTSAGANGYVIADAVRIERVGPLLAAEGPAANPVNQTLSNGDLQRAANEAVARWKATDLTSAQRAALNSVQFQIQDLPGAELGVEAANLIYVDKNAAGHGWFIDKTLKNNREFGATDSATELIASAGSSAFGKMDLLTVLMHELGHTMGLGHSADATAVMSDEIGVGTRRIPMSAKNAARAATSEHSAVQIAEVAGGKTTAHAPVTIAVAETRSVSTTNGHAGSGQGRMESNKAKRSSKHATRIKNDSALTELDQLFANDVSGLFVSDE